ncbi:hypothetical protein DICSQDRAFT_171725 [Dichomitus squalens LYAD-421 SS1]|uniref:Uncharacterized protein n=1 Tax=Dichomitus squalens (strain LYAD-421) TaxID=732165 RepID=R7SVH6_DICSQ|nr:uncharacterized protein DICSQDRAFT_171725 [Dichomitus squalens LYAD-421 SS1]EJF59760.1 hypothetical protein DICSQDRAFT_171725 [Dichomitus squalens LYAD-421 SS1]
MPLSFAPPTFALLLYPLNDLTMAYRAGLVDSYGIAGNLAQSLGWPRSNEYHPPSVPRFWPSSHQPMALPGSSPFVVYRKHEESWFEMAPASTYTARTATWKPHTPGTFRRLQSRPLLPSTCRTASSSSINYASDAYTVPAYGSNAPYVPAGQGSASTSSASSVHWTCSNAAAPVFILSAIQQTGQYPSSIPNAAHAHAPGDIFLKAAVLLFACTRAFSAKRALPMFSRHDV